MRAGYAACAACGSPSAFRCSRCTSHAWPEVPPPDPPAPASAPPGFLVASTSARKDEERVARSFLLPRQSAAADPSRRSYTRRVTLRAGKSTTYCSRACQCDDWNAHAMKCGRVESDLSAGALTATRSRLHARRPSPLAVTGTKAFPRKLKNAPVAASPDASEREDAKNSPSRLAVTSVRRVGVPRDSETAPPPPPREASLGTPPPPPPPPPPPRSAQPHRR